MQERHSHSTCINSIGGYLPQTVHEAIKNCSASEKKEKSSQTYVRYLENPKIEKAVNVKC